MGGSRNTALWQEQPEKLENGFYWKLRSQSVATARIAYSELRIIIQIERWCRSPTKC